MTPEQRAQRIIDNARGEKPKPLNVNPRYCKLCRGDRKPDPCYTDHCLKCGKEYK